MLDASMATAAISPEIRTDGSGADGSFEVAQQFEALLDRPMETAASDKVDPIVDDLMMDATTPMDTVGHMTNHFVKKVEEGQIADKKLAEQVMKTLADDKSFEPGNFGEFFRAMTAGQFLALGYTIKSNFAGKISRNTDTLLKGQ